MTWTPKDKAKRERAWVRAQTLGTFNYAHISDELKIDIKYVQKLVREWEEKGWIVRVPSPTTGNRRQHFQVVEAARQVRLQPETGTKAGNMWRTMRMLRVFSHRDIAMQANTKTLAVTEDDARAYCQVLNTAGYFRVEQKADKFRPAIYRLTKDTGPRPPTLKRVRAVWDENKGEYTYISGAGL